MTRTTELLAIGTATLGLLTGLIAADRITGRARSHDATPPVAELAVRVFRVGLDRVETGPDAHRIELAARDFLRAYLPYTHGQPRRLTQLQSGHIADPRLIAGLLQSRPHNVQPTVAPDTVTGVAIERLTSRRAVAVSQVTARAGRYSVALTLEPRAGRWTVIDTRPAG